MRLTGTSLTQPHSPKQNTPFPQEDHRARFHKSYHKVAEKYDKEFLKNTTTLTPPTNVVRANIPTDKTVRSRFHCL